MIDNRHEKDEFSVDSMKMNLLTTLIFHRISYHKCKLIARHRLFSVIRFETRTRCNGLCDFCPCSVRNETRPDVWMSEECHQKIVDELAELNFSGAVKYYTNNEPLMDDRLVDFLGYLKSKKLPLKYVCIQTNGTLLTSELGAALFENGLTWLIVNDYAPSGKHSQRLFDVVECLRDRFPGKRIDFRQRSTHEVLFNRAGFAPNKPLKVYLRAACLFPFRQLNITANGDVGFCCWDVYVQNPLGNVNKQSLTEIWYSEQFRALRKDLLRGNRFRYELCRNCEFRGYIAPPRRYRIIYDPLTRLANKLLRNQMKGLKK